MILPPGPHDPLSTGTGEPAAVPPRWRTTPAPAPCEHPAGPGPPLLPRPPPRRGRPRGGAAPPFPPGPPGRSTGTMPAATPDSAGRGGRRAPPRRWGQRAVIRALQERRDRGLPLHHSAVVADDEPLAGR